MRAAAGRGLPALPFSPPSPTHCEKRRSISSEEVTVRQSLALPHPRSLTPCEKNRIALAAALAQHPAMLARVLSAALNGIEAFPVEVEAMRQERF